MQKKTSLRLVGPEERRFNRDERDMQGYRAVNFWGKKTNENPEKKRWALQLLFWGRYFPAIEAKYLARAEADEKAGLATIKQRLILAKTKAKMDQSKEPFSIREAVWTEVEAEITQMKAKFVLHQGGSFFRNPGGSRADLSVVGESTD